MYLVSQDGDISAHITCSWKAPYSQKDVKTWRSLTFTKGKKHGKVKKTVFLGQYYG